MKMPALILAALLAACSSDHSTKANDGPTDGWRPASEEASSEGTDSTYWWRLTTAGTRLLAMRGDGTIWLSASYSNGWQKLAWSHSGTPHSFYATADSIWIGTENPGRLYGCKIQGWMCTDLQLPKADSLGIEAITKQHDSLVVFSAAYQIRGIFRGNLNAWKDETALSPNLVPYRVMLVGDTLWAATWDQGLWYRVWGSSTWTRMHAPRATFASDSVWNPRGLAWYQGALWVGDWAREITRMPSGTAPYQASRNCPFPNAPSGCRDLPVNIFTMLSYGGHLFVGGYFGAAPYVYDDATGFWITTEIKGWCWNSGNTCGGSRTWDMVGLGDTIYTTSSRFVMKLPLSKVPRFSDTMMTQFSWPTDTSWRDSLWRRNNPLN
jgi:hypothetical protein